MREREYKFTLTEENKIKVEQFLHLLGIEADIVEAENIKESEENEQWKDGSVYYYIDSDGQVVHNYFFLQSLPATRRLAMGNCFKTVEEAEFELRRLNILTEMKKFAEPEDREWNEENTHWYPYYNVEEGAIKYSYKTQCKSSDIYFVSKEEAQKCVNIIGEDKIKKYYLRVIEADKAEGKG